jgi:hypothetical protein
MMPYITNILARTVEYSVRTAQPSSNC